MNRQYIVAENAFTVSAPDGFLPWAEIENRFLPFLASGAEESMLDIDIKQERLAEPHAELIYGPVHSGIGIISASASRGLDGSLIMEFDNVLLKCRRIRLTMSPALDRAAITVALDADSNDKYILAHAIMIAFMLATLKNGTLLIHSSAVIYEGKAYLFQGKSGTGKSTHARMWLQNIDGAEQLNDDHPVIRFSSDGIAKAYGSPWSGKTPCYRNVSAPIGAFVRIVRSKENELCPLSPLKGFASLSTSVFYLPFISEELKEIRHKTIERLAMTVPCFEMHCRPDADAAQTCMTGLTITSKT